MSSFTPGSDRHVDAAAYPQFRARMRAKGQLTIPALVRQLLDIKAGDVLECEWDGRNITLRKVPHADA